MNVYLVTNLSTKDEVYAEASSMAVAMTRAIKLGGWRSPKELGEITFFSVELIAKGKNLKEWDVEIVCTALGIPNPKTLVEWAGAGAMSAR